MSKHATAVLLAIMLVWSPLSVRSLSAQQAMSAAEAQAERDTNTTTWIAAGCLLGVLGWFLATLHKPEPPATALLGQTPQYVAEYIDAYQAKAKSIATGRAMTGCLIGTGVYAVSYVVLFVVLGTADVYY